MEITVGVLVLGGILVSAISIGGSAGMAYMVLRFGIRNNSKRIDGLEEEIEKLATDRVQTGKDIVEIKTDIKHMTEDIKEIKECVKEFIKERTND